MNGSHIPPMPEGFTDRAAWDAIHWRFSTRWAEHDAWSTLDGLVMGWQRGNQDRVKAAIDAKLRFS